ncbi:MAG TPA: SPFH domain-containing protein, partial [Candidatus Paceibacterota bacterium]
MKNPLKPLKNWWQRRKARKATLPTPSLFPLIPEENPAKNLIWFVVVVYIFLIGLEVFLSRHEMVNILGSGIRWNWGWALFYAHIAYTILSFRQVQAEEHAAITLFGKAVMNIGSGLKFVPIGACSLRIFTKNIINLQVGLPQAPSESQKGYVPQLSPGELTKSTMMRGSYEGFRVNFASYESAASQLTDEQRRMFTRDDELNRRLTTDPLILVLFKINDPMQFVNVVGTLENALGLIEKTVSVTLQEYCGKWTPAYVLFNLDEANGFLKEATERLVWDPDAVKRLKSDEQPGEPWGVDFLSVQIQSLGLPQRVNASIADARKAGFQRDRIITLADGKRQALAQIGKGKGEAKKAEMEGEA